MAAKEEECLVEEREEMLMTLDGSTNPIKRKGWFLKPNPYITNRSLEVPFCPSMHKTISDELSKWPEKVLFKGWANPQRKWKQWVDKLQPIYGDVWKKAGIFDAIEVSTYKIKKDLTSICEVLQYWSYETNTFIFPFLEATITLEDVMILGGFSPVGVCVRGVEPLIEELQVIKLHLIREHKSFNKSVAKKPCHSAWMSHFMEREGDELEHIAFLSLWLSRYCFPKAPEAIVEKDVFPIAIQLAQGEKFALGPSVLASLYRDMRLLKEHVTSSGNDEVFPIILWAPFQIIQLWIWEHFMSLRPNTSPNFVQNNKPRAARWKNLVIKTKIPCSMLAIQSPNEFQWRPYATHLDNWNFPSYYRENGEWIYGNDVNEEGIISFVRCLRACELIGLDCIELYLPHRVSRQFGFDQDLLGCAPIADRISDWEVAWTTYEKDAKNFMLYIPPRLFESDVTYQYYTWWKENISASNFYENDIGMLKKNVVEMKREKTCVAPESKKQKLQIDLNTTPLDLVDLTRCNIRIIKRIARKRKDSTSVNQDQLTHFEKQNANEGEEDRRQDGPHGCKNTESENLDEESRNFSFMEDAEDHIIKKNGVN